MDDLCNDNETIACGARLLLKVTRAQCNVHLARKRLSDCLTEEHAVANGAVLSF